MVALRENNVLRIGIPTAVDLTAIPYIGIVTSSKLAVAAGAAAVCIGVLQNKPDGSAANSQEPTASVMVYGITKATAGAAIAEGDPVMTDASGKFIPATPGLAIVGIALTLAAANLDIFDMILTPGTVPVVQSAAYTRNATIVEDRTLLPSATSTIINNNNVLAALIVDLQANGLLG